MLFHYNPFSHVLFPSRRSAHRKYIISFFFTVVKQKMCAVFRYIFNSGLSKIHIKMNENVLSFPSLSLSHFHYFYVYLFFNPMSHPFKLFFFFGTAKLFLTQMCCADAPVKKTSPRPRHASVKMHNNTEPNSSCGFLPLIDRKSVV